MLHWVAASLTWIPYCHLQTKPWEIAHLTDCPFDEHNPSRCRSQPSGHRLTYLAPIYGNRFLRLISLSRTIKVCMFSVRPVSVVTNLVQSCTSTLRRIAVSHTRKPEPLHCSLAEVFNRNGTGKRTMFLPSLRLIASTLPQ